MYVCRKAAGLDLQGLTMQNCNAAPLQVLERRLEERQALQRNAFLRSSFLHNSLPKRSISSLRTEPSRDLGWTSIVHDSPVGVKRRTVAAFFETRFSVAPAWAIP